MVNKSVKQKKNHRHRRWWQQRHWRHGLTGGHKCHKTKAEALNSGWIEWKWGSGVDDLTADCCRLLCWEEVRLVVVGSGGTCGRRHYWAHKGYICNYIHLSPCNNKKKKTNNKNRQKLLLAMKSTPTLWRAHVDVHMYIGACALYNGSSNTVI